MKIRIAGGASGEVTGPAHFVQTERANVSVTADMFQGGKESEAKNRLPAGVNLSKFDAVLLTHAQLDHTGRVPQLVKHGFAERVLATAATADLAELILQDSTRLQVQDAQRVARRRSVEPLYAPEHVARFRSLALAVPFRESVPVADGISARLIEAGHMHGAASIELAVNEDGRSWAIVFSGDLGPTSLPIVREFETLRRAVVVFIESTYGDRNLRPHSETLTEFEELVKQAVEAPGRILVSTFAVGLAQQILYHLAIMFHRELITPFHVYLDSPMAIEVSKTMVKHPELFDEELLEWKSRGLLPLDKAWFHSSVTSQDSQALNNVEGRWLILAGSGMCNGGRILHYFCAGLLHENTHVLIFGYQGKGSLARRLVERARSVSIHGEKIAVRANVWTLGRFSAQAGQSDLLKWFTQLAASWPRVIITHGEDAPRNSLCASIQQQFSFTPELPLQGDVIEISRARAGSDALAS